MNLTHNISLNQNQTHVNNQYYYNIDFVTLELIKDYRTGINAKKTLNTYAKYLTKEDIIELNNNIKTASEAKKLLLYKHLFLLLDLVKDYKKICSLTKDELYSTARLAFLKACRTYNYHNPVNFIDYVKRAVINAINNKLELI